MRNLKNKTNILVCKIQSSHLVGNNFVCEKLNMFIALHNFIVIGVMGIELFVVIVTYPKLNFWSKNKTHPPLYNRATDLAWKPPVNINSIDVETQKYQCQFF